MESVPLTKKLKVTISKRNLFEIIIMAEELIRYQIDWVNSVSFESIEIDE